MNFIPAIYQCQVERQGIKLVHIHIMNIKPNTTHRHRHPHPDTYTRIIMGPSYNNSNELFYRALSETQSALQLKEEHTTRKYLYTNQWYGIQTSTQNIQKLTNIFTQSMKTHEKKHGVMKTSRVSSTKNAVVSPQIDTRQFSIRFPVLAV